MNYRESLFDLVDRIRQNDESAKVVQLDSRLDSVENLSILDALKKNTMVKHLFVNQLSQEGLLKLSAVMKCNNSVQFLYISIERGLNRNGLFITMATSGSWSSIQVLQLFYGDTNIDPLSLREAGNISNFVIQNENLRFFSLYIVGDEAAPILETLSRTDIKV